MSVGLFAQIVNIGLIVLFILIILGFLIAGLVGFKRGIWASAYRMLFMLILVAIGLLSLSPIANIIGNINLDPFISYQTIIITNAATGVSYYAPITSFHDTLTSCFRGYFFLYNVSGSYAAATEFAEALVYSVVKLAAFIVIMLLIVTLGSLLCTILWHALFKHLIPKLARKKIKVRWVGLLMNVITYTVVGFLLISPLTSMVNIINQNYSERDDDNELVGYLNTFVNSYDNSLFAQTFFNWTVDPSTGLTLDATILNDLTSTTLENGSIGVISSISELTEIANVLVENIAIGEGNNITVDVPAIVSQAYIEDLFSALKDSHLVMLVLPLATQLCLNSDLLANYIDTSALNMSDIDWDNELDVFETMAIDIANSGLIDSFVDDQGQFVTPTDATQIVGDMLNAQTYTYVYHALSSISDSKILSRAIPAVIEYIISSDPTMQDYFPVTFEALNDIDWGFELSTVFDCVYQMYAVDTRILPAIMSMTSSSETPVEEGGSGLVPRREGEATDPTLFDVLLDNIDEYKRIIVGETNSANELINLDSDGRTIVYSNGKKISGRRYSLLDLTLCKTILNKVTQLLGESLGDDTSSAAITDVMDELSTGKWMKNYKEEFNALFYCLEAFQGNADTLNTLTSGNIIPEGGTLSDIDDNLISTLAKVLKRMDGSKLIYAILLPTLKSMLTTGDVAQSFQQNNINVDIIIDGVDKAEASSTVGKELAKIINSIKDFGVLSDILAGGYTTSELIAQLGAANESIAHALDTVYGCAIINPVPEAGDAYTLNENYFNIMTFIFSDSLSVTGLSFDQTLLDDESIVWVNSTDGNGNYYHDRYGNAIYDGENGAIAHVIQVLGATDIMEVMSDSAYLSGSEITTHLASLETQYHLSSILTAVSKSAVFAGTMGTFLDAQLEQTGILDQGVSFTNVTDWDEEGEKLGTILTTIGEVQIDLSNLDLNSISNVVGLNDLLHALADSSIFVEKDNGDYLFSDWLYVKVKSSLSSFSDGTNTYDLVKDPTVWDSSWGTQDSGGYTIVENDFAHLDEKDYWYNDGYTASFDTSIYVSPYTSYTNYWDNPNFIADYSAVMELDEIGRLTDIIYWVNQAVNTSNLLELPTETFSGLLDAVNSTTCLRVATYNFFEIAKSAFTNSLGDAFFDLSPAYTSYLISCDQGMYDYQASHSLRQGEIDHLGDIYSTYRYMVNEGILDSNNQLIPDEIDAEFSAQAREAILSIQESMVFHRKGSCLDPDLNDDTDGYYPTVFQNGLGAFLTTADMAKIIYNSSSPKDTYYYDEYSSYLTSSGTPPTDEQMAVAKVNYMLDHYFDYAGAKAFDYSEQEDEINAIFTVIDSIVGGPITDTAENYEGLRKTDGTITFDFDTFDLSRNSNITAIRQIFSALNDTDTLYDCVSNSISRSLENASQYSFISSMSNINFADANIFYQYFDEDNLFSGQQYNWSAHLEDNDITIITDLLGEICGYENGDTTAFPDFDTIGDSQASIQVLSNFLHDFQESKIFHTSGPLQALSFDINHDVVLTNASSSEMTVFQEMCAEIFNYDSISSSIYNASSPKDQANATAGYYSSASGKATYLAKTLFTYDGVGTNALSLTNQSIEIDSICNFMSKALDFHIDNFDTMDVASIDVDNVTSVLTSLNNTESLYDAVPNLISKVMNSNFSALDGVTLSDATCYYHYTISGTTNFDVKYDADEIANIGTLLTDYQSFSSILGSNTIDNLAVIKALLENNYIKDILVDSYSSHILHLHNQYLTSDLHMTVFEQIINMFTDKSGLTDYAYPVDGDNQMMAKIKAITDYDEAYKLDVTTLNSTGYHECWLKVTNDDEIHALINFISAGQNILGDTGSLNVANIAMENLDPAQTQTIMMAINHVDFLDDVLPIFVRQGFDAIGLSNLSSYNSVNYAYFDIGPYQYGGARGASNIQYCEINNIYSALTNMQHLDSEDNFLGYYGMDNMIALADNTDNFDGIISFISHSRILNTDSGGNYNTMWSLATYSASARGLLVYNVLTAGSSDPANGASMGDYITGSTPEEKIATLSKIFTFANYDDEAESKGFYSLAQYADSIDGNNLDISNFDSITATRNEVTLAMQAAYDAYGDGTNVRSYFASEVMSCLLDQVMEREYINLASTSYTYTEVHFGASTYAEVDEDVYTNVNANECHGLNGSLSASMMISEIINHSIYPTYAEMTSAFTLMDNSGAAKVIYLSRLHDNLGLITQSSPPVWSDYTSDVYAAGFTFSAYGVSLANYLSLT